MQTLVTADWHLSDQPRDAYRHQWQGSLLKIVKEHQVNRVLMLGDITEEKDYHSAELVNQVVGHLFRLARLAEVIIMRGNHDGVSAANPFFEFVRCIKNITWINEPTVLTFFEIGQCLFLPHTRNYEKDWAKLSYKQHKWIFCHNTFTGARDGERELQGIPTSIFHPRHGGIISGDVHKPQNVGPVTYVGAPYTVDFGDDYNGQVILLEDTKKRFLSIDGPQKRLIVLDDPAGFAKIKAKEGDILKVRVRWEGKDMSRWPQVKRDIFESGQQRGYVIHAVEPLIEAHAVKLGKRYRVAKQLSDAELLERYCVQNKLSVGLRKTGLKLLTAE